MSVITNTTLASEIKVGDTYEENYGDKTTTYSKVVKIRATKARLFFTVESYMIDNTTGKYFQFKDGSEATPKQRETTGRKPSSNFF